MNKIMLRYVSKVFVTIILTLFVLISLKSNKEFKGHFYKEVYEKNIKFSVINEYYQKYFGSPLPFSDLLKDQTKPVFQEKLTYQSKEPYEEGVQLKVGKEYLIPVLDSGMVVYVGEKEGYGNTVIIQQVDGKDIWYSNVGTVSVTLYDYVEKGDLLGEVKDENLILVFKKDGKVLNYEDELS